jgi:hypothetical protein
MAMPKLQHPPGAPGNMFNSCTVHVAAAPDAALASSSGAVNVGAAESAHPEITVPQTISTYHPARPRIVAPANPGFRQRSARL